MFGALRTDWHPTFAARRGSAQQILLRNSRYGLHLRPGRHNWPGPCPSALYSLPSFLLSASPPGDAGAGYPRWLAAICIGPKYRRCSSLQYLPLELRPPRAHPPARSGHPLASCLTLLRLYSDAGRGPESQPKWLVGRPQTPDPAGWASWQISCVSRVSLPRLSLAALRWSTP